MSMKPRISVRQQLAFVASSVAAITLAIALKTRADTPYCMRISTVPCQAGTCVAWNDAFPGATPPTCNADPGLPTVIHRVTITVDAGITRWRVCEVTPENDANYCQADADSCATYLIYDEDSCDLPCPDGWGWMYPFAVEWNCTL